MQVTIIGTGNMARGIGSRVLARGHDLTVVGKDFERAEAVAADIAGAGTVKTAVSGDPIEGHVVVLAVYYPDALGAAEQYADQLAGKVVVDITNPRERVLRRARGAAGRLRYGGAGGGGGWGALGEGVQYHVRDPAEVGNSRRSQARRAARRATTRTRRARSRHWPATAGSTRSTWAR